MNKKDKNKVESNVRHDILLKAEQCFDEFKNFSDGVRVLFLMHRNKEGGETNNSKVMKIVSKDAEEFRLELIKLMDMKEREKTIPYRIYSSVNPRDTKKAIRKFKYEQLDAEFYGQKEHEQFYFEIKDRWIGCLMQPANAAGSLFIFDCDNEDGRDVCGEALQVIPNEYIVYQYATKNGWHIVTRAFNYTTLKLPNGVELKKDGLLLLSF